MKYKIVLLICSMLIMSFIIAQKRPVKPVPSVSNTKLGSINDTLQYAIGAYLAQWINNQGFVINNPTLFIRGMDDIFQNKPRAVPDSMLNELITAYQLFTQKDRAVKLEQQLFTNIKQRPGLGIFPNGVHYFVLKTGQGSRPNATDSVVLNLKGSLADGTVFEDTYSNKIPQTIQPLQLIPGLSEALQQMQVGAKWQLYIPSTLAHGDKGVPNTNRTYIIPPGSALIYEVELLEIKTVKK